MRTVIFMLLLVACRATVIPEKYLKYLRNISYYADKYRRNCLEQSEITETDSSDETQVYWTPSELQYIEKLALSLLAADKIDETNEDNDNSVNDEDFVVNEVTSDENDSKEKVTVEDSKEREDVDTSGGEDRADDSNEDERNDKLGDRDNENDSKDKKNEVTDKQKAKKDTSDEDVDYQNRSKEDDISSDNETKTKIDDDSEEERTDDRSNKSY